MFNRVEMKLLQGSGVRPTEGKNPVKLLRPTKRTIRPPQKTGQEYTRGGGSTQESEWKLTKDSGMTAERELRPAGMTASCTTEVARSAPSRESTAAC